MSPAPFHPSRSGLQSNSELSPAAEHELLRDVKLALRDRDRVIEAQRSERRGPDQTHADRRPDDVGIVVDHSAITELSVDQPIDVPGGGPLRRPLVVPQSSGVGVNSTLKTDILRQEPE